ncbi:hypothetical protein DGG96_02475 [Legionella qingyii]|uniref:Uncharacterized protein n=1 Tax=Legionella qingyii TaxID=2184757 RepID=A0A317U790_9GAMM|nr:hypothetical protein [Legionella qingyii]PWY56448.1 hypothetical protein DGG96_06715 [Legionella qingyii]PWY57195.1 hypothetical protein DGG96_02475 [Legionella qingyii]RUR24966.1 hypothetical protein ELY20_04205 [Legionella qingyii]RUR28762.1 hypothetical protein ELY16_01775 [Legionella qingyii]
MKKSKWHEIKKLDTQEKLSNDEINYDPIDTKKELDEIGRISYDPIDTRHEMEVLTNTRVGATVLPAQLMNQKNPLDPIDTPAETEDFEPNAPKLR